MENVATNRNCVYQTAYHLVWRPKYRHDILTGEVAKALEELLDQVCAERKWRILAREVQPDHVHLFVSIPPSVPVSDSVKILKGTTGRRLIVRFPTLKKRLWGGHLWSPSYYVGTAGHVSADTIRQYIERSEHVTKRRQKTGTRLGELDAPLSGFCD